MLNLYSKYSTMQAQIKRSTADNKHRFGNIAALANRKINSQ